MITKEEVLQKVNDYCTEKQYTTATLTDAFKNKFVDHFHAANAEGDINDEAIIANLKFALNTAFSSASELATVKTTEFAMEKNQLQSQIEELKKKVKTPPTPQKPELSEEVQKQLDELRIFKDEKVKQEKLVRIMQLAKEGIRQDLHASFDRFARDYSVKLDTEDKAQAEALVNRFQEIFKDSIGDIKPMKPSVTKKRDEEVLSGIKKIKV